MKIKEAMFLADLKTKIEGGHDIWKKREIRHEVGSRAVRADEELPHASSYSTRLLLKVAQQ
jgi:hypothetical protein